MDSMLQPVAELEQSVLPRLHEQEQKRYQAFTHPQRRLSWLAGRMLLLAALAQQSTHVDATALHTGQQGGVDYRDGDVQLSLSHSHGLIVAAISDMRIGVDIEWPRPRPVLQRPLTALSHAEALRLQNLADTERQDAFYCLWTLKEAACKASGVSLWECLRSTSFDPDAGEFNSAPPFPLAAWRFLSARIEPGWWLALAAQTDTEFRQIQVSRLIAGQQWLAEPLSRQRLLQGR